MSCKFCFVLLYLFLTNAALTLYKGHVLFDENNTLDLYNKGCKIFFEMITAMFVGNILMTLYSLSHLLTIILCYPFLEENSLRGKLSIGVCIMFLYVIAVEAWGFYSYFNMNRLCNSSDIDGEMKISNKTHYAWCLYSELLNVIFAGFFYLLFLTCKVCNKCNKKKKKKITELELEENKMRE